MTIFEAIMVAICYSTLIVSVIALSFTFLLMLLIRRIGP